MGRSDHGGRCWRHPKHQQSIGVCPFCLRERLSRLSHNHSSSASSSGSSSPYSTDSDLSSSSTSPPHAHHSDAKGARISFLLLREHALTKSRSMAFVSGGEMVGEEEEERKGKEKKKKFWAKLLMGGSERKQKMKEATLMHSRTLKEKPPAKWALFA